MLLQKNSDKVKQIPDNEAKRISNANEVIILRDQDKEIKFKSPIKEDDDYYMYMISHFIDDDFSLKSAEEDSKRKMKKNSNYYVNGIKKENNLEELKESLENYRIKTKNNLKRRKKKKENFINNSEKNIIKKELKNRESGISDNMQSQNNIIHKEAKPKSNQKSKKENYKKRIPKPILSNSKIILEEMKYFTKN